MKPVLYFVFCVALANVLIACNKEASSSKSTSKSNPGEVVSPPFEVKGTAEGLLLVWFDDKGAHTVTKREDVPANRRERVRVDSLSVAPEQRLDSEYVYIADLRAENSQGRYVTRKVSRETFEQWVDKASGVVPSETANANEPNIIIYGTSWCGVCRAAARFFRERNIAFVEKDIEKDSGARAEMQDKLKKAGRQASGVPVIDLRGTLMQGFDEQSVSRLLAANPS